MTQLVIRTATLAILLMNIAVGTTSALPAALNGRSVTKTPISSPHPMWVTAYVAAWQTAIKPADLDLHDVTDLIYFGLMPTADGGVDASSSGATDDGAKQVLEAAHSVHAKALICLGGNGSAALFNQAASPVNRAAFVRSLTDWVKTHSYDGIDLNIQPLTATNGTYYRAFVRDLHHALKSQNRAAILTAAVDGGQPGTPSIGPDITPSYLRGVQDDFDQINLRTDDLSFLRADDRSWYDSPLYTPHDKFKAIGPVSCDQMVNLWIRSGVKPAKLGILAAFFGVVNLGITGPGQPMKGVVSRDLTYTDIMKRFYRPDRYRWDAAVGAPALIANAPNKADRLFVSYDDERLCAAKVAYARGHGLGGVAIFEITQDLMQGQKSGPREPLLHAIIQATHKQPATKPAAH